MLSFPQNLNVKLENLFKEERSRKLFINVIGSFIVKIFSMGITLSLIPISLNLTDKSTYGLWLTLSSVITSFYLLDFGLSHGLTNKFTEALAKGDIQKIKNYLSTTYGFLISIIFSFSIPFLIAIEYINWNSVFHTNISPADLRLAIQITFFSFCLTFILNPVNDLLRANQKHFMVSLIQVGGNLIGLILIVYFAGYFKSKFIFLCAALSLSYPASLIVASLYFYMRRFKHFAPNFKNISKTYLKDIFGLSGKFFIIQLSDIVIISSVNILISHYVSNEYVTYYNIAYRLFSIVAIFQVMVMTPLWPAITDAFTLKDYNWISSAISKSNKLNLLLWIPLLIFFTFSDKIYRLWIGPDIKIPFEINLLIMIYIGIGLFKETYVSFINGVGKLNLQTIYAITAIVLQIPFAYLLTKILNLGLSGILILNIFWVALGFFLWKIQYWTIMNKCSYSRIWN